MSKREESSMEFKVDTTATVFDKERVVPAPFVNLHLKRPSLKTRKDLKASERRADALISYEEYF